MAEEPTQPCPGDPAGPDDPSRAGQHHEPDRPMAWSGRAGVPVPDPLRGSTPPEWAEVDDRDTGRWWMPILVGALLLLLLGTVAVGVWLLLAARDDGTVPVDPPSTGTVPSTPASPTSAPTPTPTPGRSVSPSRVTTTSPAGVRMPSLIGLPVATAQRVLEQLGIEYRIDERPSDRPPGTVLEAFPGPGTLVQPDEEVTIVVAVAVPVEPPGAGESPAGSSPTNG